MATSDRVSISTSETGQVAILATATLIAHATIDVNPVSTYPRRKRMILCNTGTSTVFIGVGFQPTSSNYSFLLVPSQGTLNTSNFVAPGLDLEDDNVFQDNIYGICATATTSTINVTIGA